MKESPAVAVRVWPELRGWRAGAAIAAVLVAAAPAPRAASAQTALVLAAEQGDAAWRAHVGEVVAAVSWTRGPVSLAFGAGVAALAQEAACGPAGAGRGVEAVVAVPLYEGAGITGRLAPGEAGVHALERVECAASGSTRAVILQVGRPVAVTGAVPPAVAARDVERSALEALARLVAAGGAGGVAGGPVYALEGINVTATRDVREVFTTPAPVIVLDGRALVERAVNGAPDLFLDVPGLDGEGVGVSQRRPVIRGLAGQRVLLLEDGIRLNSFRRRVDSGEPPALAGLSGLERIEVVRGPASVLYGSDAIGGVVNLITARAPAGSGGADLHGSLSVSGRSAGDQRRVSGSVAGGSRGFGVRVDGDYRVADAYTAPAGRFGRAVLRAPVRVHDTGVTDHAVRVVVDYALGEAGEVFARYSRYRARDAGFGYVDPALLGQALPRVRITFPDQRFERLSVGLRGAGLGSALADRLEVVAYGQSNERDFVTDVFVALPAPAPPGAAVTTLTRNFTDLDARGVRAEGRKLVRPRHLLTYGLDFLEERAAGRDTSTRTVTGLGPPKTTGSGASPVPDALLRSLGAFLQAQSMLASWAELTVGVRYQAVGARTLGTGASGEGSEAEDRTVVGAANLLVRAAPGLSLVASVGRGFRSPNLVERFYSGPTPEGRGVWVRNPELRAEKSLNVDLGARWRSERLSVEGFAFRNVVRDAIELEPTSRTVNGLTELRNVNVGRVRFAGVELSARADLGRGLSLEAGYASLRAKDLRDPARSVAVGYRERAGALLRYSSRGGRWWLEYAVRRNSGEQALDPKRTPVGEEAPAFAVHAARAGLRVSARHRLTVAVENLADALYSESANTAFFRPEPGRHVAVSWVLGF